MRAFIKSLGHAWEGVVYIFHTQRNFRIHLVLAVIAMIGAMLLKFSPAEWGVVFAVIGLVISAEAFNTAIERAVDCAVDEHCEEAKQAKDSAAAGVLLMTIMALFVGGVLYVGKIVKLFL